ncbi:SDR family oxidoreductase [Alcaligenaceae bacterium]|nr:SDR family oxidoreductase [Alcaligenaceae bacterium]
MDLCIKGKVALVTGGGGGLGGAIANSLAREGAKVIVADVNHDALDAVVGAIRARGGEARGMVWDLADTAGIPERMNDIVEAWGNVGILVNNTGGPPPTTARDVAREDWEKYFQSMVAGVIKLTDAVLPGMVKEGWGRVITSTSSGVIAPIPNLGISNTLRSALLGWSKTLSREVARDGITVNVILPGRIATQRIRQLDVAKAARDNRPVEEIEKESTGSIPVGRYGKPSEYGDTVAFLSGTAASYITGSVIRVDGGLISSI